VANRKASGRCPVTEWQPCMDGVGRSRRIGYSSCAIADASKRATAVLHADCGTEDSVYAELDLGSEVSDPVNGCALADDPRRHAVGLVTRTAATP
jgi:hypothetical protein